MHGKSWGDQFGSIVDIDSSGETIAVYAPGASSTPCQIWALDNASTAGECPENIKDDIQLNLPKGQISVFSKLYSPDVDGLVWVRHYSPIPIGTEAESNITLVDHKLALLNDKLILFSLISENQEANDQSVPLETSEHSEPPARNLQLCVYELINAGFEFTNLNQEGDGQFVFKDGQKIWRKAHSEDLFLHDIDDNISLSIDEASRTVSVQKNSRLFTYQLRKQNNGLNKRKVPEISQLDSNFASAKTSASLFYDDNENTNWIDDYGGIVGSPLDLKDGLPKGSVAVHENGYEYLKLAKPQITD